MFNELLQKQNQFYTEHRYRREERKKERKKKKRHIKALCKLLTALAM